MTSIVPVKLSANLVEALAGTFLSPRYDDPRPTPQFHRECWELYSSDYPACMAIAPRDHAKTTGLTYDYVMAEVLFRSSDYVIIISSTEEMASEIMLNISEELHENQDLRIEFGVKKFLVDSKTDIIVEMVDGHKFRILARGAEQRIRGRMWNGKRPNLMVCDDMEDDEQVENRDRRLKFRKWFFRAAKQALRRRVRFAFTEQYFMKTAFCPASVSLRSGNISSIRPTSPLVIFRIFSGPSGGQKKSFGTNARSS